MEEKLVVPTMAEMMAKGEKPEVLFWVGCAGSFDDRAKKITKAFVKILNKAGVSFAVLGTEEACSGDPAKRAGNEFLFQMQAMMNIQVMQGYEVTKVVTTCPHCFNTLRNEYPKLGGEFQVVHHTQFINDLLQTGTIKAEGGKFRGKRVTFHDPCYLGRGNDVYEAPREVLQKIDTTLVEMARSRKNSMCCGAGGAQMFKEAEKGEEEVNVARTRDAIDVKADVVATGCAFCNTMMTDGMKHYNKENEVEVLDVAELIAGAADL